MLATLKHDFNTKMLPYMKALARKVRYTLAVNTTVMYLLLLCTGVIYFYLLTYKGVVKHYCHNDTSCHSRFEIYNRIGGYIALPILLYGIVTSIRYPVVLTLLILCGLIGFTYMNDAWKVTLDGIVIDENTEWTLCRLLRKYAPHNPTKAERALFVLPMISLMMILCLIYLFSIMGLMGVEVPYFIVQSGVLFSIIIYATYRYTKY